LQVPHPGCMSDRKCYSMVPTTWDEVVRNKLAEHIAAALAVIPPSGSDGRSAAAVLAAAAAELIRDLAVPLVYRLMCGRWVWPDECC
jgi:hypothetical protein